MKKESKALQLSTSELPETATANTNLCDFGTDDFMLLCAVALTGNYIYWIGNLREGFRHGVHTMPIGCLYSSYTQLCQSIDGAGGFSAATTGADSKASGYRVAVRLFFSMSYMLGPSTYNQLLVYVDFDAGC